MEKKAQGRPKGTSNGFTTFYFAVPEDEANKIDKELEKFRKKTGLKISKSDFIRSLINKSL